jgi:non-reducing end alpha-L-arabinofuranosidase
MRRISLVKVSLAAVASLLCACGASDSGGAGGAAGAGGAPGSGTDGGNNPGSNGPASEGGPSSSGGTATSDGSTASGGGTGPDGSASGSDAPSGTGDSGTTSPSTLPGDVAEAAGTRFVAAHALTRALFASYNGPLFRALRVSDKQEKDIGVVAAGGLADLTTLRSFCSGTSCKVTALYDQTGNGNDMWRADTAATRPCDLMDIAYWQMSDGTNVPIALEHGWESNLLWKSTSQCLRNRDKTKNMPKGAQPQSEYAIFHGKYVNGNCCFDYGNTETGIRDDGNGSMGALTFTTMNFWSKGSGNGPWPMMDWENGVYAGNIGNSAKCAQAAAYCTATGENPNPTVSYDIATIFSKDNGVDHWQLKSGNAKTGPLSVNIDLSALPNGYSPLKLEGGLSLGEGGAGDSGGSGGFSEGGVIAGETTDTTDTAIQTSIVNVYGK